MAFRIFNRVRSRPSRPASSSHNDVLAFPLSSLRCSLLSCLSLCHLAVVERGRGQERLRSPLPPRPLSLTAASPEGCTSGGGRGRGRQTQRTRSRRTCERRPHSSRPLLGWIEVTHVRRPDSGEPNAFLSPACPCLTMDSSLRSWRFKRIRATRDLARHSCNPRAKEVKKWRPALDTSDALQSDFGSSLSLESEGQLQSGCKGEKFFGDSFCTSRGRRRRCR